MVQTENSSLFGGSDEWEGKIAVIETFINRAMHNSNTMLTKKMNKIQEKNTLAEAKFTLHEREIKSSMGRLENKLERFSTNERNIKSSISELERGLNRKLNTMQNSMDKILRMKQN